MAKYKFNINKPDPSDEEINRHKDFKKLKANYHRVTTPLYKTPLYKNKKVFLGLLLVVVIAYLISEAIDEEKKNKKEVSTEQKAK